MPSLNDRIAVRIPHGWRTYFVYGITGALLGTHAAFHEEAARREVARTTGLDFSNLTAEPNERT